MPSCKRAAKMTSHKHRIITTGSRAQHQLEFSDKACGSDRDKEPRLRWHARGFPPYQRRTICLQTISHPMVEILQWLDRGIDRNAHRNQKPARSAPHRGEIADHSRDSLPADAATVFLGQKMNSLDERVGLKQLPLALRKWNHRTVITWAHEKISGSGRHLLQQPRDESVLAYVHDASHDEGISGKSPARAASCVATVAPLKKKWMLMDAQSDPVHSYARANRIPNKNSGSISGILP